MSRLPSRAMLSFLLGSFWAALLTSCRPAQTLPASVDRSAKAAPEDRAWWQPTPGLSFQVQYAGDIDLQVKVDVIALDLFETSMADIQYLHRQGIKVIGYLNAGAWEAWRPDRNDFPASVLGAKYHNWPGERWLDIRQLALLKPILEARLDLCKIKGFDGVDADNLDGYDNPTGFAISPGDQIRFNRWLAQAAHQRGLGIGLKNNPQQAAILLEDFDWITTENCFKQNWCQEVISFVQAGKPVFAIEYRQEGIRLPDFCDQAAALKVDAILKNKRLDAWLAACPSTAR